jgi:hypothetical protein
MIAILKLGGAVELIPETENEYEQLSREAVNSIYSITQSTSKTDRPLRSFDFFIAEAHADRKKP